MEERDLINKTKLAEVLILNIHTLQAGWIYSRWINPTTDAASQTLNSLEGGHGTLLFSSGMAAISTALFAVLKSGDHVVSKYAWRPCGPISSEHNSISVAQSNWEYFHSILDGMLVDCRVYPPALFNLLVPILSLCQMRIKELMRVDSHDSLCQLSSTRAKRELESLRVRQE